METKPDSALNILQQIKPAEYKSDANRALYNLLYSEALEKNYKPLMPDSIIDFSINYYQNQNDQLHLARCYYSKGFKLKYNQRYDDATVLFLKALDCLQDKNDLPLSGHIYSNLGDIYSIQNDYKGALKKYTTSLEYFNRAGMKIDENYENLFIGRTYLFLKDYKTSQKYFRFVLKQTKDSTICGVLYQEMGLRFYNQKQLDSAQYFFYKCLHYPAEGNNYSIRNFNLADLLFDKAQYDSSFVYATISLKHPASFYTRRECYRILANIEYIRNDIKQLGKYIAQYQSYGDSIRNVESQTKCSVLENLHAKTQEANGAKRNSSLIVFVLIFSIALSTLLVFFLYKRYKLKKEQLDIFKAQLTNNQNIVSQELARKIEQTRALQVEARKNASVEDRLRLDKELYNSMIYINDWDLFQSEMNHAFNNIVETLKLKFPEINQKEIMWCCLNLLDIPHSDRIMLLDATSDSLYKLKQRLALKLNLKSTRNLSSFLKELAGMDK
ncbi:MAG: tetratricopeptide repeat protein [Paludibacter sp.]|nr:tetratricopeptide repeat protein [Paludibacter sp.]